MNPSEIKKYLDSFVNFEFQLQNKEPPEFSLNNIKNLLILLDNPQDSLRIIHVAGSKGKGSICAMTADILRHAGYKVGLYTSPHFEDVRERIRVLDKTRIKTDNNPRINADIFEDQISEEEICGVIDEIKWALDKVKGLTYFEVLTAVAFFYFKKQKVEFAVIETGLGGRLDATNVGPSLVCAVSSISIEHVHILGDTLEKIAFEKASIIKDAGQKVVLAPQDEKVLNLLTDRCKGFGIEPIIVGRDIKYDILARNIKEQIFNIYCDDKESGALIGFEGLKMPLLGRHQAVNAAVSIGIIFSLSDLGFDVPDDAVLKGLKELHFPGRFEISNKSPLIILDGAHNEESAICLVDTFRGLFPNKKCNLILGLSKDKDKKKISNILNGIVDEAILTRSHHPRSLEFSNEQKSEMFPGKSCIIENDINKALEIALEKTGRNDILLATGSLFVVAEVRSMLRKKVKGKR